jgi:hypothetical protein
MRVTLCAAALAGTIWLLPVAQLPSSAQTGTERNVDSDTVSDIVFPNKAFSNTQAYVAVQGTLTADWLAYPNNTYSILCVSVQCLVASVRQIGPRQIGAIDGPIVYPVIEWSKDKVIAQDDDLCASTIITIDRNAQTVFWVETPINQTTAACQSFRPITARTASIEAPPFWKSWRPK